MYVCVERMDLAFKVQLSHVRGKQLHCPNRTGDSFPMFRLNFDQKLIESELFQGAGDPEWQSKASFEYRLRETTLQDAMTSLSNRRAQIDVAYVDMRGGREAKVGSCSVDLLSICTGPHLFHLNLQSETGAAAGSIYFSLVMEQQTTVSVEFSRIEVSGLPRPAPYRLAYQFAAVVGRDVESAVSQPSVNPAWGSNELPRVEIRSTLRALLASTLRVHVEDMQQRGVRIVAFDLAVRELVTSNTTQSVPFKRNAYGTTAPESGAANFAALATGIVQFSNLPIFAQFEKGENQQGSIHGKPLMAACPTPSGYSKVPKRLPDMRPGQAQFEVAQHAALQPSLTAPSMNTWGAQPAPQLQHFPAPPVPPTAPQYQAGNTSAYMQQQWGGMQQTPAPHQSFTVSHQQQPSQYQPAYAHAVPSIAAFQEQSFAQPQYAPPESIQQSFSVYPSFQPPYAPLTPVPPSYHQGSASAASLAALRAKSPLAGAGESLIRQHADTVAACEQQQRRIQALAQELHERTVAEVAGSERRIQELDAEEHRVRDELRRYERAVDDLRRMKEEHEAAFLVFSRRSESDKLALINELEDISAMQIQLNELARQINEHAQEAERNKERTRMEIESARSRFDMDTKGLGEVESKIQYRLVQPPPPAFTTMHAAAATLPYHLTSPAKQPFRVSTPPRTQQAPPPPIEFRSLSPSRQGGSRNTMHSTGPSFEGASEPPVSYSAFAAPPMHADVDDLVEAVRQGDNYRFQQVIKRSPKVIFDNNNLLHIACAQQAPDYEMVSSIVYYRPELINGIDTTTGSTALHFACKAQVISMPVVDLLLSKGASTTIFDSDGLNPFHVAVRNLYDTSHALKKLLLFKGGVDINCVTSRGETSMHMICTHDKYLEVVRFLVSYGANLHAVARVPNAENRPVAVTPLEKCRWFGPVAEECRRFLERSSQ